MTRSVHQEKRVGGSCPSSHPPFYIIAFLNAAELAIKTAKIKSDPEGMRRMMQWMDEGVKDGGIWWCEEILCFFDPMQANA